MKSKFYYNQDLLSGKFEIAEQYVQNILCFIISERTNDTRAVTLVEEFNLLDKLKLLATIIKITSTLGRRNIWNNQWLGIRNFRNDKKTFEK